MSGKKPTMRDIAKAVGTSAVTVSKAITGKPGMSDKLRSRILRKAEEMGYRYAGRTVPRTPEHLDIGILIPERYFHEESFYSALYKQLILKLSEYGHFGLLEILNPQEEAQLTLPNLIRTERAQGLIMLGSLPRRITGCCLSPASRRCIWISTMSRETRTAWWGIIPTERTA